MSDYETAICQECGCKYIIIHNREFCSRECELRNHRRTGKATGSGEIELRAIVRELCNPRKTIQPSVSIDDVMASGMSYAQYQAKERGLA